MQPLMPDHSLSLPTGAYLDGPSPQRIDPAKIVGQEGDFLNFTVGDLETIMYFTSNPSWVTPSSSHTGSGNVRLELCDMQLLARRMAGCCRGAVKSPIMTKPPRVRSRSERRTDTCHWATKTQETKKTLESQLEDGCDGRTHTCI